MAFPIALADPGSALPMIPLISLEWRWHSQAFSTIGYLLWLIDNGDVQTGYLL
jgi:hypothetical protein